MKPETLERIGDPFFTTKEPGHGMGLGIFLTQNVLRRLGGELHFESRIGSGTLATIRLPVA
jgi:two-component system sensor histidine kinase RegB